MLSLKLEGGVVACGNLHGLCNTSIRQQLIVAAIIPRNRSGLLLTHFAIFFAMFVYDPKIAVID